MCENRILLPAQYEAWDKYKICPCGKIYSPTHILRINKQRNTITLTKTGAKPKKINIANLVLLAFSENKPNGKNYALHIDGDRNNNHIDNLRWATHYEIMAQHYGRKIN